MRVEALILDVDGTPLTEDDRGRLHGLIPRLHRSSSVPQEWLALLRR